MYVFFSSFRKPVDFRSVFSHFLLTSTLIAYHCRTHAMSQEYWLNLLEGECVCCRIQLCTPVRDGLGWGEMVRSWRAIYHVHEALRRGKSGDSHGLFGRSLITDARQENHMSYICFFLYYAVCIICICRPAHGLIIVARFMILFLNSF